MKRLTALFLPLALAASLGLGARAAAARLVRAFVELMLGGEPGSGLTSLDVSLESHSIALAAVVAAGLAE